ncbi:ABC transporter related (plasmid) [Rhodospirillum rubrum ATCC 11170]|uniref:ABC transporter related n=1 Tax=Rhodospirillum rubrum (strain ATCC 11170 / ATH 1.1.1 / DSM 467 / LMG 4362 / NCIMB 8255 / S1) TaxID=269796 RepID=Q2RMM1_RHORT|nr:ABC transporter ATP-binding protein [Rhodospirillum rubrum]ABC24624.1 ABC transporter related [Rhodospirillum rubrum ATCC 11170]QXG82496.1 ABC transporter ATP-binding protein [Rhodospirillum rubrum]
MSSDPTSGAAITVEGLKKVFRIYERPRDRILQLILPGKRKFYREFQALDDVSFTVQKGQAVGIIGRNGSGKSTLLQMICGILHPTAGKVSCSGRVAALLELGAGFNPDFTGRENVYMNATLLGLTTAAVDERMDDILAFAEIGDFIDHPVKTYSSGMFVRLAFAVMAHVDAEILIIDEALAVGDAAFGQKCMRFLRRFRETGTILFVSHDTAAVIGLCDRAVWLDRGKMIIEGDAKTVCEAYYGHLFGGTVETPPEKTVEAITPSPAPEGPRPKVRAEDWVDGRREWINHSSLRNDIEVFTFDPSGTDFGAGGAEIEDVRLTDDDGHPYAWIVGGEPTRLRVTVRVRDELRSPIIGFFVKDRLGQTLFGDNTFMNEKKLSKPALPGQILEANFRFPMPILPPGTYSIAVAVADGTQTDHVQHHWLHDAVMVKSHVSHATAGLVGIPMFEVRFECHDPVASPSSSMDKVGIVD